VVSGPPPTSAALIPPLPISPWQATHFCANDRAPCAGVAAARRQVAAVGQHAQVPRAISAALRRFTKIRAVGARGARREQ
jgi:hypothetical protein